MSQFETFPLGPFTCPRLFTGYDLLKAALDHVPHKHRNNHSLWQLSSAAWGTAPASKVRKAIASHIDRGYTAFGE